MTYDVSTFLVTRQGRLSLYGLLNLLQDTSIAHANLLGHGMSRTSERQALWVLTRQKVEMKKWPSLNERISIRTWVRPAEGAFAVRDFEILSSIAGDVIGEATTSWLLLHADTRKPIREDVSTLGFTARTDGRASFDAEKVAPRTDVETLARIEVRNSDIDGNNHVNNTRYAQWILDAIPIAWHSQYVLENYSVNFLAETRLGDAIDIQSVRSEATGDAYYHGLRVSDQKIVFTASLRVRG
jgi:medium-chain acyl-[acyl-carrier-protein] hydrolase